MRRTCVGVLAVAAGLIASATPAAHAQSSFAIGAGRPITQQMVPARISGRILVQFHGAAAAGCMIRGLCGYSGTVSWSAPGNAQLDVQSSRVDGRTQYTFALFPRPSGSGVPRPGVTSAQVTRTPFPGETVGSACVDATSTGTAFVLAARGGRVQFSLGQASPSLFATRCAGPRDAAILPLLPSPQLSVSTIRRGRLTVAFPGSRSFAAGGFAGTVVSDVVIRLGRPGPTTPVRATPATGPPRRGLQVRLRAALVGAVVEQVAADTDPGACTPLGACGATGSLTIRPPTTAISTQVQVLAPAGRPAPDLSAAAGTGAGRAVRVSVFGIAPSPPGGTVDAMIGQGLAQCNDSATWGGGLVTIAAVHGRLVAGYSGTGSLTGDASVTGCPGPMGGGVATPLAAGSVPLSRLTRRRITISLTTGSSFQDYGYHIRTTPDLTLTLIRVSARAISVPAL